MRHPLAELKLVRRELRDALFGVSRYTAIHPTESQLLPPYWVDLVFTLHDGSFRHFDPSGVPVRVYRDAGLQYNPTRVAGFALASWNAYLQTGNSDHRGAFLRQADWFLENARPYGDAVAWEYDFDWAGHLRAPWISGMSQGEALSVLSRAFLLTENARYAETARRAVRMIPVRVAEGGVLGCYPDGSPCIEEYPDVEHESHVLNGFIFALLGLHDYVTFLEDHTFEPFFRECIGGLTRNLWRYDIGFWSRYDLAAGGVNVASFLYHDLHIALLTALYYLTSTEVFGEYADRWAVYRQCVVNRLRAFGRKVAYRLRNPAPR